MQLVLGFLIGFCSWGFGSLRKESGSRRTHWMFEKGEEQWDGMSRKMEKEKKKKKE